MRFHHLYLGLLLITFGVSLLFLENAIRFYISLFAVGIGLFLTIDDLMYHLMGVSVISRVFGKHYVVILTTFSDEKEAKQIIKGLLEEKLIACGNRVPCASMYWWKGKTEQAKENYAFLKTTTENAPQVTAYIRERHSYEVPQILVLPIKEGNQEYLAYIKRIAD